MQGILLQCKKQKVCLDLLLCDPNKSEYTTWRKAPCLALYTGPLNETPVTEDLHLPPKPFRCLPCLRRRELHRKLAAGAKLNGGKVTQASPLIPSATSPVLPSFPHTSPVTYIAPPPNLQGFTFKTLQRPCPSSSNQALCLHVKAFFFFLF